MATSNADWLRDALTGFVLDLAPSSVLDVGAGQGGVTARLVAAGVVATGIEADPAAVDTATAAGLDVRRASAEDIPFEADAFDVAVMRHVPHHLADYSAVADEMRLVARRAVVVAEPWFNPSIASQRVARQIDDWIKSLHRRQGRIHEPNLDAARLLAPFGAGPARVQTWLRLESVPLDELDAEVRPLLDAVGDVGDRSRYEALRSMARNDGLTRNGSLAVAVTFAP